MNWRSQEIDELVRRALAEDVGTGDATTAAIVPAGTPAKAHIIAREPLVCAGLPIAESIFRALDREMRIGFLHEDGSFVESGAELVEIAGEAEGPALPGGGGGGFVFPGPLVGGGSRGGGGS